MDIVVVFNGLGNQMSQYAFYMAKKNIGIRTIAIFDKRSRNRHNGSELENLFGVNFDDSFSAKFYSFVFYKSKSRVLKWIFRLLGVFFYYESLDYNFDERKIQKGKGWLNFYIGGWHSEKYFRSIRNEILDQYKFNVENETDKDFLLFKRKIENNKEHICSIHVRRGDYLESNPMSPYQYHSIATDTYYKKAIRFIKQRDNDVQFYIFSNDILWCKKTFGEIGFEYVECNTGSSAWRDMFLMSLCQYHIIANSSFSWWGSWLCVDKQSLTVCPERFLTNIETRDFYPDSWVKVSSK